MLNGTPAEHVKQVHVCDKEGQQLVLQVKEAEVREAAVRRDVMVKKVGDLEMANQVCRGRSVCVWEGKERTGGA